MDELTRRLAQLRIERANNAVEHHRFQEESNQREITILAEITAARQHEQRRTHNNETEDNLQNNRDNPLKVGEVVRITNAHKGAYGVCGKITHIGGRMVDIRCVETGKRHTRAWWNLQRASSDQSPQ